MSTSSTKISTLLIPRIPSKIIFPKWSTLNFRHADRTVKISSYLQSDVDPLTRFSKIECVWSRALVGTNVPVGGRAATRLNNRKPLLQNLQPSFLFSSSKYIEFPRLFGWNG